jgi:hypothetical protein
VLHLEGQVVDRAGSVRVDLGDVLKRDSGHGSRKGRCRGGLGASATHR